MLKVKVNHGAFDARNSGSVSVVRNVMIKATLDDDVIEAVKWKLELE